MHGHLHRVRRIYSLERSSLDTNQASPSCVEAWIGPHEGVQYTCRAYQDVLYAADAPTRVVPVFPQPALRNVILLDVRHWVTDQLMVLPGGNLLECMRSL